MTPDRLAYMANQIAAFFATGGRDRAVESIADHLQKFWEPRMRRALLAQVADGGAGLDPLVIAAARRLKPPAG
jgi:formate dehydrogenase subunit delta